jgi:tight adherence protein C
VRIDPVAVQISVLALAGTAAFVAGVRLLRRRVSVVDRLAPAAPAGVPGADRKLGLFGGLLLVIGAVAHPTSAEDAERLRLRLQHAGLSSARAESSFRAAKVVLGFGLLAIALFVVAGRPMPVTTALFIGIVAFSVGFYAPDAWLASRTRQRQAALERALPDALDLLVTCVEAGLGLDAALQRVATELRLAWPILAREFDTTFLEINAGIARSEAFRRLAARTGVKELKSLAATLTQTEIFGTSVAIALRVQGEGIRTRRMQRAEEKAAYAGVKMTVPLICCIVPSLIAVVVGPAVVNIAKRVLPMIGGR